MATAADSANFSANKPRSCTRCRRSKPVDDFKKFRGGRIGLYCRVCRDYEQARYERRGRSVKRGYYARQKDELSPLDWRAQRLRYGYKAPITAGWLMQQWDAQDGRCAITGRPLDWDTIELDHIVPRSRGGSNDLSNLRLASRVGNTTKSDLLDDELVALCSDILARFGR